MGQSHGDRTVANATIIAAIIGGIFVVIAAIIGILPMMLNNTVANMPTPTIESLTSLPPSVTPTLMQITVTVKPSATNNPNAELYVNTPTLDRNELNVLDTTIATQYMAGSQTFITDNDFLTANAADPDVYLAASGLQYKIVTEGIGERPTITDSVTVTYEGRLIDGTVFDLSRGPITFNVNEVILGWVEGLQLMNVGSTYIFYIPPELAYGKHGRPPMIPPNAVLIFQVELISIGE